VAHLHEDMIRRGAEEQIAGAQMNGFADELKDGIFRGTFAQVDLSSMLR